MRVAVAGGTGLVGTMVVRNLERSGHEAVVLSRSHGADLVTGRGVAERVRGCRAMVDVSNQNLLGRKAAVGFFGAATRQLLEAGADAGVEHLVTLSIVGIDQVDLGYYAGKRRQEELVVAGPLPWTILRATQFHEFPDPLLAGARVPIVPIPRMRIRPVAAVEVAAALAELVAGPAGGYVRPMAGPEEMEVREMVRRTARARGRRTLVLPVRLPGRVGRALAGGALLPRGPYTEGQRTFADHLAEVTR